MKREGLLIRYKGESIGKRHHRFFIQQNSVTSLRGCFYYIAVFSCMMQFDEVAKNLESKFYYKQQYDNFSVTSTQKQMQTFVLVHYRFSYVPEQKCEVAAAKGINKRPFRSTSKFLTLFGFRSASGTHGLMNDEKQNGYYISEAKR